MLQQDHTEFNLTIQETPDQGLKVVFTGDFADKSIPEIEATLNERQAETFNIVFFDFQTLKFIASSGLGFVVRFSQTLQKNGGKLVIINVPPIIRKILRLTRLDKRIEIYETDPENPENFSE